MEKHPLVPEHLRSARPENIPLVFKPTQDLLALEATIKIVSFPTEFITLFEQAKVDLMYFRTSMVDGTIAARPTYLTEFMYDNLDKMVLFFTKTIDMSANANMQFPIAEMKHVLFFCLEANLFFITIVLSFDKKTEYFQFWKAQLETFNAPEKENDPETYAARLEKLEILFGQPRSARG